MRGNKKGNVFWFNLIFPAFVLFKAIYRSLVIFLWKHGSASVFHTNGVLRSPAFIVPETRKQLAGCMSSICLELCYRHFQSPLF